jgi:hypothetical protein
MGVYFSEREKKRIFWRRLKIFGFVLLIVALSGGIFYAVSNSKIFKVSSLEVTGNDSIQQEEIISVVHDSVLSRSFMGKLLGVDNIFVWSNEQLPEVADKFAQISSLDVKRDLFSRKVTIEVKERERKFVWCFVPLLLEGAGNEKESCFWTDETGFIFDKAPVIEGQIINIVKEYGDRSLEIGDYVLSDKEMVVLNADLKFLEDLNFAWEEMRIENLKYKELVVLIKNGPKIYFSLLTKPDFGKKVVQSLLNSGKSAKYIDLRVDGRVFYE